MQNIVFPRKSTTPINILFIYPNTFGMNMLPPAIALFNALLKREGHEVRLFDATYYSMDYGVDSDGSKADNLNVAAYDPAEKGITMKNTSWFDDLQKEVDDFEPDLIAMSTTEDMWNLGLTLLDCIKNKIKNREIVYLRV
jgi:anaerobic magnesium-protoporphyrin IX monomethyl ester cyclase